MVNTLVFHNCYLRFDRLLYCTFPVCLDNVSSVSEQQHFQKKLNRLVDSEVGEKTLEVSLFGKILILRSLPGRRWQLKHASLLFYWQYLSHFFVWTISVSRCKNLWGSVLLLRATATSSLTAAEWKPINSKRWIHPRKRCSGAGIDLWTSEGGWRAQQAHKLTHKHRAVVHCLDLTFRIDRAWSILHAPLTHTHTSSC